MRKLPESVVHMTMFLAFTMMFLNVIFVKEEGVYRSITLLFLFIFGFLMFNQLYGKMEEKRVRPSRRMYLYSELAGKTVLVEYSPTSPYENIVMDVVDYFMERAPVLLISSLPRSSIYLEGFREGIGRGKIKLVEITMTGPRSVEGVPIRFPLTELEWLKELYTSSPDGSAVIFEPLSDVIMNIGSGPSYKLLRYWLEMCTKKNMSFIAFLNQAAHHKEVISAFEGLFLSIALAEDQKLFKMR